MFYCVFLFVGARVCSCGVEGRGVGVELLSGDNDAHKEEIKTKRLIPRRTRLSERVLRIVKAEKWW
jgi:hypothetical protein